MLSLQKTQKLLLRLRGLPPGTIPPSPKGEVLPRKKTIPPWGLCAVECEVSRDTCRMATAIAARRKNGWGGGSTEHAFRLYAHLDVSEELRTGF